MAAADDAPLALSTPDRSAPSAAVRVWDLPVRLFHWMLVLAVAGALVTGYLLNRSWLTFHVASGTAIIGLIVTRIVWGFLGTRHARFASFLVSPTATIQHTRELIGGHAHRHLGHNPLGAWMIVALLLALTALALTGVIVLGGFFKSGPLAYAVSFSDGRFLREIHSILAVGLVVLVGLHLAGTLFESLRSRENLVAAMITGKKRSDFERVRRKRIKAHPIVAAALVLTLLAATTVLVAYGNSLPGRGVPQGVLDPAYVSECGSCHTPYHPSLAPASSWKSIMSGLESHFGENAQLDGAVNEKLALYLTKNSAEHFDTLPANVFRTINPSDRERITATPAWKRLHREIPAEVFAAKSVGANGACAACHRDAVSGLFNPAKISIPAKAMP